MKNPNRFLSWLGVLGALSATFSVFLGATVILGWHFHIRILVQIHPEFAAMQYNAALGFLLGGMGLIGTLSKRPGAYLTCGFLLTLLGCLTLSQYAFNMDLGIDRLFLEPYILIKTSQPGRMGPNTALCFLLSGLAILSISPKLKLPSRNASLGILGSIIMALGTVAVIGYLGNLEPAYGWGNLSHMALHTALGFITLGAGFFLTAWKDSSDDETELPEWLYLAISIGVIILALAFWMALTEQEGLQSAAPSYFPLLALILGIVTAFFLGLTLRLAQATRTRTHALEQVNQLLQEEVFERQTVEQELRESRGHYRRLNNELEDRVIERTEELSSLNKNLLNEVAYRKKVQNSLTESESRYRSLFEDSPISLWELDLSRFKTFLDISIKEGATDIYSHFYDHPEEILEGYSKIQILDLNQGTLEMFQAEEKTSLLRGFQILFEADPQQKVFQELIRLCLEKSHGYTETQAQTLRGEVLHLSVSLTIAPGFEKSLGRIFVSILDITEKYVYAAKLQAAHDVLEDKIAARTLELRRSNQELEQFAYVASHDLQEPLRMVSSYLGLLERNLKDQLDEKTREFLHFAVDGASRMKGMITDLLTYSRVGRQREALEKVSCEEVLKEVLSNLTVSLKESKAIVTHDPLPEIYAVRGEILQLLQNLVGNAVKYRGDQNPHIKVGWTPDKDPALFYVRDNGLGIDEKSRERVFEIFQRLQSRSQASGTGIGLSICKKIVEQYGGRIWVEGNPQSGSTFYFTLDKTTKGNPHE
jgi:signal transduction histidine kinase